MGKNLEMIEEMLGNKGIDYKRYGDLIISKIKPARGATTPEAKLIFNGIDGKIFSSVIHICELSNITPEQAIDTFLFTKNLMHPKGAKRS